MSDTTIIGDCFSLGNKIGTGSFGDIYDGEHIETKERVAIKLEPTDTRVPQLAGESRVYQLLEGSPGIPRMYHYGKQGRYFVLVMELLGKSLDDLCARHATEPFSNQQVMELALQILDRLELLHSKGYIYRDIKPANFLFGRSTTPSTAESSPSSSTSISTSDSVISPTTSSPPTSPTSQTESSPTNQQLVTPSPTSQLASVTSESSSGAPTTTYVTLPSPMLYLIDFGLSKPLKDGRSHHNHSGSEHKQASGPHHSPHNSADKALSSSPTSSSSSPHNTTGSSDATHRVKEPKRSNSGGLIGTARYASIGSHEGRHLSQRDDLESVAYVLIYMIRGELPWQRVYGQERQDVYDQIAKLKKEISLQDLCMGVPTAIMAMLMYVKTLEYGQQPDYGYLKQLFSPQNSASTSLVTKETLSVTLSREHTTETHSPVSTLSSISGTLSAAHSRHSSSESNNTSAPSSPMVIPYASRLLTPTNSSPNSKSTTPSSSPVPPPRISTPDPLLNAHHKSSPRRSHSPSSFDPLAMLGLSRHHTDGKTHTSSHSHSHSHFSSSSSHRSASPARLKHGHEPMPHIPIVSRIKSAETPNVKLSEQKLKL